MLLGLPLAIVAGYYLRPDPAIIASSIQVIELGETRVGQSSALATLSISNLGERMLRLLPPTLDGRDAADFTLISDTCTAAELAARASCVLELTLRPGAAGLRRGELRLTGNASNSPLTIALLGSGTAPELRVEPQELDFGTQRVGTAGRDGSFMLTNLGSAPLNVGQIEFDGLSRGAGDFVRTRDDCSQRTLAPDASCQLAFGFMPTEPDERSAALRVPSDAVGSLPPLILRGHGAPQEPKLGRLPEQIDLGPLPVGEAVEQQLTLTNDGESALIIKDTLIKDTLIEGDTLGEDEAVFTVEAEACLGVPLATGTACHLTISFAPHREGTTETLLDIVHNDPNGPHQVRLSGIGTVPRALIEPSKLAFGEVPLGTESAALEVRLRNDGTAPLTLAGLSIAGADRGSFAARDLACRGPLEPGASCPLAVAFSPQRRGPHRAELVIAHNAGTDADRLPLSGIGVAAELTLDRSELDCGEVEVGDMARHRLTLTNTGRAPLFIRRARIRGAGTSAFRIREDACSGQRLRDEQSCQLEIRCAPQAPGAQAARLSVEHDAAAESVGINLRMVAVPATPKLDARPRSFDFGSRAVGDRSPIATLTLENRGRDRLRLTGTELVGTHLEDFQLVPGSCAEYLAADATCTFGIRFAPTLPGPRAARLLIRTDANEEALETPLTGRGIATAPIE